MLDISALGTKCYPEKAGADDTNDANIVWRPIANRTLASSHSIALFCTFWKQTQESPLLVIHASEDDHGGQKTIRHFQDQAAIQNDRPAGLHLKNEQVIAAGVVALQFGQTPTMH